MTQICWGILGPCAEDIIEMAHFTSSQYVYNILYVHFCLWLAHKWWKGSRLDVSETGVASCRYVTACALSPTSPLIATGSMDKTVNIWRLEDACSGCGEEDSHLPPSHSGCFLYCNPASLLVSSGKTEASFLLRYVCPQSSDTGPMKMPDVLANKI